MQIGVSETSVGLPVGRVFVRRWIPEVRRGAPIVLLHDSLGSVEQWRDFPQALASTTQREVIAYDRLGFGRSSPRDGPPSTDFIAEEGTLHFPALGDALGLSRYALFGHSVGGAMAVAIAANDARCEAVITESAQAFVELRTLDGIRAAQALFADPAQFAKLERWHGDKARWVLQAWTEVWLAPEFRSWSLDALLPRVACPVLAIHGDRDEYGSVAFPRRIADLAAGPSEAVVLEGCGHVPHRERREEVLRLASGFLAPRDAPSCPAIGPHGDGREWPRP